MKTEHLKNFIAVVECGTISGAAGRLHIAQPALSVQMKSLEEELGTPLLKRLPKSIELTGAGRIFYEKSKTIISVENSIYQDIDECIKGGSGTLNIGMTPAHPDPLITKLLTCFHRAFPKIQFEMVETHSQTLMQLLRDNLIDIAIIRVPGTVPAYLSTWYTIQEHLCVTYSAKTNWFPDETDAITIPMLRNVPISITNGFKERFTVLCEDYGFSPNYFSVCSSRNLARIWAEDGSAAVILSEQQGNSYPGLRTKPIFGVNTSSTRAIVTRNGEKIPKAVKTFLSYCQNWLQPAKSIDFDI